MKRTKVHGILIAWIGILFAAQALAQPAPLDESQWAAEGQRLYDAKRYREAVPLLAMAFLATADHRRLIALAWALPRAYQVSCAPEIRAAASAVLTRAQSDLCNTEDSKSAWLCNSLDNRQVELTKELTKDCAGRASPVEDRFERALLFDLQEHREEAARSYWQFLKSTDCVAGEQGKNPERRRRCQSAWLFIAYWELGVSTEDGARARMGAKARARAASDQERERAQSPQTIAASPAPPAPAPPSLPQVPRAVERPEPEPQAPDEIEQLARLQLAATERRERARLERLQQEERERLEALRQAALEAERQRREHLEALRQAALEAERQRRARLVAERQAALEAERLARLQREREQQAAKQKEREEREERERRLQRGREQERLAEQRRKEWLRSRPNPNGYRGRAVKLIGMSMFFAGVGELGLGGLLSRQPSDKAQLASLVFLTLGGIDAGLGGLMWLYAPAAPPSRLAVVPTLALQPGSAQLSLVGTF